MFRRRLAGRAWCQRSFRIAPTATGTPAWTVGYLSVHPSMDFARSFLTRSEQVTDSVQSSPACWTLSATEMDGGVGLARARAATEGHSFWVGRGSSTRVDISGTGR